MRRAKRWSTVTQEFDYDDKHGVAVETIMGVRKLIFGSGTGDTDNKKDNGVVTGFFATTGAATTNGVASGSSAKSANPLPDWAGASGRLFLSKDNSNGNSHRLSGRFHLSCRRCRSGQRAARRMGHLYPRRQPDANDVIRFCKVPAGATVIGGFLQGADIDTGTEALDIDIGWEANGTDAADTDGFGNLGTIDGDAVSMFRPVAGIYYPFTNIIQDNGFKTFAAETYISGLVNTAANAGGTGLLKVVVYYVML
jgi:hypothetical protein